RRVVLSRLAGVARPVGESRRSRDSGLGSRPKTASWFGDGRENAALTARANVCRGRQSWRGKRSTRETVARGVTSVPLRRTNSPRIFVETIAPTSVPHAGMVRVPKQLNTKERGL